jgi:hypothetical protein
MTLIAEWRCWQIMQCDPESRCPAKECQAKECWEIIGSHDPCAFNICRDCLVYVAKMKDSSLTPEELIEILNKKGLCRTAEILK